MITPQRALVRPRVHSPGSGELLLLEDEVRPWVEASAGQGGVAILGPPSSGKTTALRHLAAVLPSREFLLFDDEPDLAQISPLMKDHLVIFTSAGELPRDFCPGYRLAGWTRDDWIEYLLAAHKDRCASVLDRIWPADRSLLKGNPELWSIVLEELAADESLTDGRHALLRHLDDRIADPGERQRLAMACITALVGPRKREGQHWLFLEGQTDEKRKVLRHMELQVVIAAKQISSHLSKGRHGDYLFHLWPRNLVEMTASFLVGVDRARNHLEKTFARRIEAQAMAASLFHALDRGWRPNPDRILQLNGAYLDGAAWAGISLPESQFFGADLTAAELNEADLRSANFNQAGLFQASLRGAKLTQSLAKKADFRQADLTGIQAYQARWEEADLSEANCEKAVFRETRLQGANLSGGNFRSAQFIGAELEGANVEDANFSGVDFRSANLAGLCLRSANLTGASFQEANLARCDLEYVQLPQANFQDARLVNALLTGTIMPGANFRNANLRKTGLADIEWEHADLRGADLRGASFHLGSSRSGLVNSFIAGEGSRTGFYTDDFEEQHFKAPEEIRKANLCGADLRGARLDDVDFYLVDLRGAQFDPEMEAHFRQCGAILG